MVCNNAMTYNQKRSRIFRVAMTLLRAGKKALQNAEAAGREAIMALHPEGPAAALADEKNHPAPEPTRNRKGSADTNAARRGLPPAGPVDNIKSPLLGQQSGLHASLLAQATGRGSAVASLQLSARPESSSLPAYGSDNLVSKPHP